MAEAALELIARRREVALGSGIMLVTSRPLSIAFFIVSLCFHFILSTTYALSIEHQTKKHQSINNINNSPQTYTRRDVVDQIKRASTIATATAISSSIPSTSYAAISEGLASKLSKRDPAALKNSVFNIPPGPQVYPDFMRGKFDVTMKFRGFIFPSTMIPKGESNVDICVWSMEMIRYV